MQITITQSEIETAIRNYVMETVNVREGKDITIDLRATRGSAGYTAEIDIVEAGTIRAPRETVTGLDLKEKIEHARLAEVEVPDAPEAEEEAEEVPADDVAEESKEVTPWVEDEKEDDSKPEAAAKPANVAKKSIFGDLKKPQNA